MKKLNITKEQFNRSGYFKNKYGKLEYVSESGRLFKTDKGRILMFKEAVEPPSPDKIIEKWIRASIKDGTLPGVEKFKVSRVNQIKYKGSFMYWAYVLQQIGLDSGRKDLFADESEEYYPTAKYISKVEGWLAKMPEEKRASLVLDALDKVYEKGGVFTTANIDHTWLGIPGTKDGKEYVLYKGHEVPKDDIYEYLAEDYPEFSELENDEDDEKWLLVHKKEVTEMLKEMAWAYDESTKKFGRKFNERMSARKKIQQMQSGELYQKYIPFLKKAIQKFIDRDGTKGQAGTWVVISDEYGITIYEDYGYRVGSIIDGHMEWRADEGYYVSGKYSEMILNALYEGGLIDKNECENAIEDAYASEEEYEREYGESRRFR